MNRSWVCSTLILVAMFAGCQPGTKPSTGSRSATEDEAVSAPVPLKLKRTPVAEAAGPGISLNAPEGYQLSVSAEGMPRARFFARAPDGRLFVTGLHSLADNQRGRVYILDDADPETGRFAEPRIWLDRLRNPNSLAFYEDSEGRHFLYLALTDELRCYLYEPGETAPSNEPEVLHTFPGDGLSYKYGGWHLTRTLAVGRLGSQPTLFASVGSSCNLCEEREDEPERATVVSMSLPDGELSPYVTGLRNAVGLQWVDGRLLATNMGADHLGRDVPQDHLYALEQGRNYGWPYCYEHLGQIHKESPQDQSADREQGEPSSEWRRSPAWVDCADVPRAMASFAAHSSPLGFTRIPDDFADERLRGYFLVALHGPIVVRDLGRADNVGYRIVRIRPGEAAQDVVTGFVSEDAVQGRPCDILVEGDRDILFTDDHKGLVYRLRYEDK